MSHSIRSSVKKGSAIVGGLAVGQARVVRSREPVIRLVIADVKQEMDRFHEAAQLAETYLISLQQSALRRGSTLEADILTTQIMIFTDPLLAGQIQEEIEHHQIRAESAVWDVFQRWIQQFLEIDDPYMRARSVDLVEARDRLLDVLAPDGSQQKNALADDRVNWVYVYEELPPTLLSSNDREKVSAFVSERGGLTGHGAILARSLSIPTVTGVEGATSWIQQGDRVWVDGESGLIYVNPSADEETRLREQLLLQQREREHWQVWKDRPAITAKGQRVQLSANIGSSTDALQAVQLGIDGVGLYRTEYLFLGRSNWPTEEEQYEEYRAVAEALQGKPVTVRTLDVGGDKQLSYFSVQEKNPFLGLRGVRISLKYPEVFKTQLRAIYRASIHGSIRLMFPMIQSIDEWLAVKSLCEQVRQSLDVPPIPLGLMVETPATVMMADLFLQDADFLSIGTNDLTQYTLAVDRENDQVGQLYDAFHPAVFRMIQTVVRTSKQFGKPVSVCGELAGDLNAVGWLIHTGITDLSVGAGRILQVKQKISECGSAREDLLDSVNQARSSQEIREILKKTAESFT